MERNRPLYNQNLVPYTAQACTIFTMFNIIRMQYWIVVSNDFIIKTCELAEKQNFRSKKWWAIFSHIYPWFARQVYNYTWVELNMIAEDINSEQFAQLVKEWQTFWLWLLYAWADYRKVNADWEITEDELETFSKTKQYWHNMAYRYWYIIETLWSAKDKTIKMDLKTLRKWVKLWIYRATARSFVMVDKLLEHYLKEFQAGSVIDNIETLPKYHKKAIEKALKLRTQFK